MFARIGERASNANPSISELTGSFRRTSITLRGDVVYRNGGDDISTMIDMQGLKFSPRNLRFRTRIALKTERSPGISASRNRRSPRSKVIKMLEGGGRTLMMDMFCEYSTCKLLL